MAVEQQVDVEAWREELRTLRSEIDEAKSGVEALYDRRKNLFRLLLDAGEKQAAIARLAGVTPMAVAFAVGKGNSSKRASA